MKIKLSGEIDITQFYGVFQKEYDCPDNFYLNYLNLFAAQKTTDADRPVYNGNKDKKKIRLNSTNEHKE